MRNLDERDEELILELAVNVGDDCPVFDGLFDYCSISAGGSMGAYGAARIWKLC